MKLPKLVITDIDGVWTDGGMYYDQSGNEWKKFNTSDSAGVVFLRLLQIPLAVITSENTEIVARRMKKLEVNLLFQGVKNKFAKAQELCTELRIQLLDVAFIGDDMNDINLLQSVGISGCPCNAPDYVKKHAKYCTKAAGGNGAFREFVEVILKENNLLEKTVRMYLDILKQTNS